MGTKQDKPAIVVGSTVRLAVPPPPVMIVVDVHVDLERLREDPLNPVIVAECQWETPEEEEGMGPVLHTIARPFAELEAISSPTPKAAAQAAEAAAAGPTPKAHGGAVDVDALGKKLPKT